MFHSIQIGEREWPAAAVVEALEPHLTEARMARMRGVLANRLGSLALGIEDLHHSHNGSACLRTAEALGVQDVVTAEIRNAYPLDERVHRKVSMAAHYWLDVHKTPSAEGLLGWARERNMRVFGAGPRGDVELADLPIDQPLMVLFGNEAEGLLEETQSACDGIFRIPMFGFTESYNVSVSVGMVLADLSRRIRAQLGAPGDLDEARKTYLLARWCAADLRGAEAILRHKLGAR